jgi:23S rRNA (guanosine2251-2'-O)-methyltransferase
MTNKHHKPKSRKHTDSRLAPRPEKPGKPPEIEAFHQERPAPREKGWLYGIHAVLAALANPRRQCRRLLVTEETQQKQNDQISDLLNRRKDISQAERVPRSEIDALFPEGAVHQGIAIQIRPLPSLSLHDLLKKAEKTEARQDEKQVVVLLDQVNDPHNVGAILRSTAALGGLAVVLTDRHAPEAGPVLAKAASGALETVPLIRTPNLVRAMDDLKQAGFWCVGLDSYGEESLAACKLPDRIALILGAEGKGLRRLTRKNCDFMVKIPLSDSGVGAPSSLNVSNAAAIALYELLARK